MIMRSQSHSYDKVTVMIYKVVTDINSHNYEILNHIVRYKVAVKRHLQRLEDSYSFLKLFLLLLFFLL